MADNPELYTPRSPGGPDPSVDFRTERVAKKVEVADRRRKVAAMMLARTSQREIARMLNVSPATISDDLRKLRGEWNRESALSMEDHIATELAALNADERTWRGEMVRATDIDLRLKIYDRVMRIMESRRRLLGLEAPIRMELARKEAERFAKEYDLDVGELIELAEEIVSRGGSL